MESPALCRDHATETVRRVEHSRAGPRAHARAHTTGTSTSTSTSSPLFRPCALCRKAVGSGADGTEEGGGGEDAEDGGAAAPQVCVFAFDILSWAGESTLDWPLERRRALLRAQFAPVGGQFQFSVARELDAATEAAAAETAEAQAAPAAADAAALTLEEWVGDARDGGCEGLMCKALEAPYDPGARSLNWLKLKCEYASELGGADSLDLAVVGANWGNGRRKGMLASFVVACRRPRDGKFCTVARVGTGLSDELMSRLTDQWVGPESPAQPHGAASAPAQPAGVAAPPWVVDGERLRARPPDLWLDETQICVWEVQAAQATRSPVHTACLDEDGRGLALRFPRLVRERPDKHVTACTSEDELLQWAQTATSGSPSGRAL